jgi:hypothetical protein
VLGGDVHTWASLPAAASGGPETIDSGSALGNVGFLFLAHSLGLDHEFLQGSPQNRLEDFSIQVADQERTLERMLLRG